jgi:phosphoenolpyruvate carboxykinase (diphosphate)
MARVPRPLPPGLGIEIRYFPHSNMQKLPDHLDTAIGYDVSKGRAVLPGPEIIEFINLQLSALGQPIFGEVEDYPLLKMGRSFAAHYQARERLRDAPRAPVDARIEGWLAAYCAGEAEPLRLPDETFILSQHGLARTLSIPANRDHFASDIIDSYRVAQGVLHNPKSDRRTTQGVFHVTEGGLPIPADKKAVPKNVFAALFRTAMSPPDSILELPFTAGQEARARTWVSLLLRPVVCPEVPGFIAEKRLEVRFFAPGNLVSNLDFVESIFGNAGDPYLKANDAGLDVEHWTGHTGCIILAPHLVRTRKKDLGLPHVSEATERQKRERMCWENEDEFYNDGSAFKITARDESGVVVTLIADNYFGYCKKEVKTQIGFSANLFGLVEEEHAGGALAFPSYDLGEDFRLSEYSKVVDHSFSELLERFGGHVELRPEGYAVDKTHPDICYLPEDAHFRLHHHRISWTRDDGEHSIKLLANRTYVLPSGYKVQLVKPGEGRRWRLIGTSAQPTMCHKPCTVSGGGKSEISKSIADATIQLPFYVSNLELLLSAAQRVLYREYGMRFKDASKNRAKGRPVLSPERSLGSVIKLLTPRDEYTDEHNAFVRSIQIEVKEIVLLIKRFYKPDWGTDWRDRFSVDVINGTPGHELKYKNNKAISSYLRVGYEQNGSWRVFGLRKDFAPAAKIQMEDDITASVVVPRQHLTGLPETILNPSLKFTYNCEFRLFQRPDDAIVRGYDKKAEWDMAQPGSFFSNYQPLTQAEAREIVEDAVRFDYFTAPMKALLADFVAEPEKHPEFIVCSANPRLVDGVPTKNPRYLQTRQGLESRRDIYLHQISARLFRRLGPDAPLPIPVDGVLPGRRNNPPDGPIRNLAVFNPVHFLPLPEAFMEFISSMTGKSPSTTGAGSEGALTKGPFNALLPISDLNAAFVSFVVTGYEAFITAAGYVGPKFRVDHDISLLVPELWCRMKRSERDPRWLIEQGCLEAVPDMEIDGRHVPSSILGYRITVDFVTTFFGRVFSDPAALFTEDMLKPELQDAAVFADGIDNMMATHRRVAANYFEDGSIELACPPLRALLHLMRDGAWEGKTLTDPDFRALFDREAILRSDWYSERLDAYQRVAVARWDRHCQYLESFGEDTTPEVAAVRSRARSERERVGSSAYREALVGTIGRDPRLMPT